MILLGHKFQIKCVIIPANMIPIKIQTAIHCPL